MRDAPKWTPGPSRGREALPVISRASPGATPREVRFDLLRMPLVGGFLRWRHGRTVLQWVFLGVAVVVVLDGFLGPPEAARNAAGLLPWVHWRGFVVVSLLVAGNLFCMACPFMLPRGLAKRWLPGDRLWPRALRSKWVAIALLVVFFWSYEAFDLWASPWVTAWIVVAYFGAAFVVDGWFRGAAFCKYLCPIGQFHFVQSMASPLEVTVRDPEVCADCRTKDCIRGRREPDPSSPGPAPVAGSPAGATRLVRNGCELWLFQERKVGNLDCTFCLDCVHACPHDNVGILSRPAGRDLWDDPWRSGVGRLSRRPDLAALAVLLTFAAFVNAFGMVAPVHGLHGALSRVGLTSPIARDGLLFVVGLVVAPALVVGAAAASGRLLGGGGTVAGTAVRFAYSLVPVGFGMWIAHYLYHFLVAARGAVPLAARLLGSSPSAGGMGSGAGTLVPEGWILPLQLIVLETGLLASIAVAWRISRQGGSGPRALGAFLPWAGLALLLSAGGIWLLLQPMEMRGMIMGH